MTPLAPFDCREAFRRLDDYLDRELSAEELERVRAHLAVCETCAREFRFDETVLARVRARLARLAAPPDLLEKIQRRLARPPGDR